MRKDVLCLAILTLAGLFCAACAPNAIETVIELTPLPTATASPTPEPTSAPTPTPTPTPTPAYPMKTFKYKPAGYVVGNSVNMRSGPGTEYAVLCQLKSHAAVTLIAESGEWYYILSDDAEGFVNKEFVVIGSANTPEKLYSDDDIYMAAQMIYLEAKGGTYEEYQAIANVLANRIRSRKFPNSVEGNIFAPGQFSVADDRSWFLSHTPDRSSRRAAESVLNGGERVLDDSVMYFRAKRLGESWGRRVFYKTIGNHCFFK